MRPQPRREAAMRSALYRACEIAAVVAILALTALQILQGLGDPAREFIAMIGACVGLLGVAAGDFVGGRAVEPTPQPPEAVLKEAMDRVLTGLRGYLEDNLIYRDDLRGIDAGLANATDPARAREVIAELRAANPRMEPGETAESFVHRTDARLMRAKNTGRNRVVADDSVVTPTRAASRA